MVRTEKTIPKGTLVRVTAKRGDYSATTAQIAKHGKLWLVDTPVVQPGLASPVWYWCKALTSGMFYDFHIDEMTIVGDQDD